MSDSTVIAAPPFECVEIPGAEIRADPETARTSVMTAVRDGAVVLVRGFFDDRAVAAIKAEARRLRESRPSERLSYRPGGPDFHHLDAPRFRLRDRLHYWRQRRPIRPRNIHSHKFMLWNDHEDRFQDAARSMLRLRNGLYGVEPDFAVDPASGYFTVVHVQHYLPGGGYLAEHSDAAFHVRQGLVTELEIIALLTMRGRDYREGGLFVRIDGQRQSIEDYATAGDLVIYDVKRRHGCAPVDPNDRYNPETAPDAGRWIMLVPPYGIDHFASS